MGKYPKCSEIFTEELPDKMEDISDFKWGSIVEIISETRFGKKRPDPYPTGEETYDEWVIRGNWEKDVDYSCRIDEDGNNIMYGMVTKKLCDDPDEERPMVTINYLDDGRVQKILDGEEKELYHALMKQRHAEILLPVTPRETELLRKHGHEAQFFPESKIPTDEDDENEWKASFQTPTDKETGIPVNNFSRGDMTTIRHMVSIAVAAFANCDGGKLFIGVTDGGKLIGPKSEPYMEMKTITKFDAYKRVIQDSIFNFTQRRTLKIKFLQGEDKKFLVLDIKHDKKPTYVTPHGTKKQDYYIRQYGESVIIDGDEMINHIKNHHPTHFGSNKNDTPEKRIVEKMSSEDWREITVRFSNKCLTCKGQIEKGETALWSKGVGVKHTDTDCGEKKS